MHLKALAPANVVLFERWAHPVAARMLPEYTNLDVRYLSLQDDDAVNFDAFSKAHVYQARSTRSELPRQFWPDAALLARCPNLLAVSTNGSGTDTVDIDACTAAGVLVVNQAGGNKQGVAEHAIGMMLCLSKKIVQADKAMRKVPDLQREAYMGNDSFGKTLGIVGIGQVGTHVAKMAAGLLNMRVLAYDPLLSDAQISERGAEPCTLDALLSASDFVSVHCPRTRDSEGMLNASAFEKMKPTAYFITTARGGIHDESADTSAAQPAVGRRRTRCLGRGTASARPSASRIRQRAGVAAHRRGYSRITREHGSRNGRTNRRDRAGRTTWPTQKIRKFGTVTASAGRNLPKSCRKRSRRSRLMRDLST